MLENVVIGKPLVDYKTLLSFDEKDWEENEKGKTLITDCRYLPLIMKLCGIVSSISEVKRNKPELDIVLNTLDCRWVKWGKKFIYIIVGE